jgi:adenosylcobinamide-phosphate guanylyltransferase
MAIAALVMAGGKASRMHANTEKPLLRVGDKPMIQRTIEALREAESVNRIIVTVTSATRNTAETAKDLGAEVVETAGKGFEQDMKQAIKTVGLEDVLIVSADLPFLTPRILDDAVKNYLSNGKPALMVAAPVELFEKLGMRAAYTFDFEGHEVAPVGLNVIDGRRIDEERLDEFVFVTKIDDLVFNVNTQIDLELARNRGAGRSRDEN